MAAAARKKETLMRKLFRLLLMLACGLLAACTAAPTPEPPAVARIGYGGSPDTLNPGTAVLTEAYTIFALVYDAMYTYNLDGTYSLGLAESVDRSADGLTYTYKIRSGIKFHDGQPPHYRGSCNTTLRCLFVSQQLVSR